MCLSLLYLGSLTTTCIIVTRLERLLGCVEVATCELIVVVDCIASLKAELLALLLAGFQLQSAHHIVRTKEQSLVNISMILTF